MLSPTTLPESGLFEYSYPTFDDKPQRIYVHIITPDQQQAFVTFPNSRFSKTAQLIPVSWFKSVSLVQLEGKSPLMYFLESMLPRLINQKKPTQNHRDYRFGSVDAYTFDRQLAA